MNRAEQAEKTTKALYGGASALGVTDPEFAAIKERLIYGGLRGGKAQRQTARAGHFGRGDDESDDERGQAPHRRGARVRREA